jgi:hypothetical protein
MDARTPPLLVHCLHCAEWKQPPPILNLVYTLPLSSDLSEASFPQRDKINMGIHIEFPAKVAQVLDESSLTHSFLRTAFSGGKSILPTSAKFLVPS